jgi:CSLREA domain-containing protein
MRMLCCVALGCVLMLAAGPAWAKADFLVNSAASDSDAEGCEKAPGDCTLREAIEALNIKKSGSIEFDPSVFPPGSETPINTTGAGLPVITASKVRVDGTGAGVEIDAESAPSDGLVIQSGAGNPLSDVQIRAIRIKTPAGAGLSICGGEWPGDCDQPVSKVVLDRVEARGSGDAGIEVISGDLNKLTIKDCTAVNNGSAGGILVDADDDINGATLMGNTSIGNDGNGIEIDAGTAAKLKILENHTAENGFNGISLTSGGTNGLNAVGNHAIANGSAGLRFILGSATKITISDNTVTDNDGALTSAALALDASTLSKLKFERNVATGNGNEPETALGIRIAATSLTKAKLSRNQSSGNDREGVRVQADDLNSVTIERSIVNGNGDHGMEVAADVSSRKVRISKNTLDGNAFAGLRVAAQDALVDGNRANANGEDGILLADAADGSLVQKNITDGNRRSGIFVQSNVSGATLQKNRARGNAWDSGAEEDLFDDSSACVNNTWKQNDFGSNDPACIQ